MAQIQQIQRVLAGYRVTIFNKARERLRIKEGDYVIVRLEHETLTIIPAEVKPRETKSKKTA